MKLLAKTLAVVALAAITSQAAFAHDDHRRDNRGWNNNGRHIQQYAVNYPQHRHYRDRNGSYVDRTIGPDGYPAYMGGYRPR
jgi:hypothetical protein